ncbi:hypothetical protein [Saccharomonospora iraqiensis]|uniref:hypothetical protein n=1 Tax=Saccharomonospora iraqiensis TaxID=52698 RepID=UPI00022E03CC|nr:hypothetical protein [Saccharomonospora iraqiensis]
MTTHARITRRQWHALDDTLAEVCERTGGELEDLHDRAVGILAAVRPAEWRGSPDVGSARAARLWRHIRQVVGSLAHLEDAAPDDAHAVRTAGREVLGLAERMCAWPPEPPG